MARNTILLSDFINDFMLMHKDDDYVNNIEEPQIRVYSKRGLRELGFDMLKRIKSILLPLNTSTMSVDLPDDYVNYIRIGTVGSDGLFYIFGENKSVTAMLRYDYENDGVTPIDTDGDGVNDRVDAKDVTVMGNLPYAEWDSNQYLNDKVIGGQGGLYGYGGAHREAYFRINNEQNRIELSTPFQYDEVAIEYVADEALAANLTVHPYVVDALDKWVYNEIVSRSSYVPNNEKNRAERVYLDALKKANSRMRSFTKDEAIATNRKQFRLSPKY